MSACPSLSPSTTSGIAEALRAVDCLSAEAAAGAFGRLFGPDGRLGTALTLLLTLYVGLLALNLLTGRSRLGLNMLTPRMLVLGLVLTFATSWVAYQSVVWTLLTGAPDQVASIVTGQAGSATSAFAYRLDALFNAVASAAEAANMPAPVSQVTGITPAPPQAAGWTAGDVLWMAALLLLLGTVGVLLVARIALAALLALGPVFIVFALFRGTHGLFVGWLKGAVMFALVPLFTVLIGGAALMLLSPIVAELAGGAITMRAAVIMFLGATVYVALMVLVLRVASVIVSGWWLGGGNVSSSKEDRSPAAASSLSDFSQVTVSSPLLSGSTQSSSSPLMSDRVRAVVESSRVPANDAGTSVISDRRTPILGAAIRSSAGEQVIHRGTPNDRRVQGLGARFRSPLPQAPGKAGS